MNEYICISMSRYEELFRHEMERNILLQSYQTSPAYSMEAVADAVFGKDSKYRPADQG